MNKLFFTLLFVLAGYGVDDASTYDTHGVVRPNPPAIMAYE